MDLNLNLKIQYAIIALVAIGLVCYIVAKIVKLKKGKTTGCSCCSGAENCPVASTRVAEKPKRDGGVVAPDKPSDDCGCCCSK